MPLEFVLSFMLMDLGFYYWHVANHRVPFLWRFHNVHHIDPDLDVLRDREDFKKLIAYSSVSHLGFCMLGMFSLKVAGLNGSLLYMVNHGLSTGALFLVIGMIYERYHTREIRAFGGLASGLAALVQAWASWQQVAPTLATASSARPPARSSPPAASPTAMSRTT